MDTEMLSEQVSVATGVSENVQVGMLKNMVPNPG